MNVIPPTININGTSGQNLLDQATNAGEALREAFRTLQDMAPNGRDYQTAPVGAYETARSQHNSRMSRLDDISKEIEEVALQIHGQMS